VVGFSYFVILWLQVIDVANYVACEMRARDTRRLLCGECLLHSICSADTSAALARAYIPLVRARKGRAGFGLSKLPVFHDGRKVWPKAATGFREFRGVEARFIQ
jgi:hypothetical protein